MDLYTRPSIFRSLKILQLLLALACLSLEITQIVEFSKSDPKVSDYFDSRYRSSEGYGVKIFFYCVIIITIIGIG
ncbi:18080_t:CDS:2, partial [Acaulospora morrowiae]